MYLYFGIVKRYISEKGFGFLSHPINLGPNTDVFFHITAIEKCDRKIAGNLVQSDNPNNICFWYIAETTDKGEQLRQILTPSAVFASQKENPNDFIDNITRIWEDIDNSVPFWLNTVTLGLVGPDKLDDFEGNRVSLIKAKDEKLRLQHIEEKRLQQIEEDRLQKERVRIEKENKLFEEQRAQERKKAEERRQRQQEEHEKQRILEEEEFEQLVAEMKPEGFTQSSEVSHYIIRHRLGDKYQNISGLLKMANGHSTWNFNGGFPPHIYARLCRALGLGNKGTDSKVIGFTSFKKLRK